MAVDLVFHLSNSKQACATLYLVGPYLMSVGRTSNLPAQSSGPMYILLSVQSSGHQKCMTEHMTRHMYENVQDNS